MAGSALNRLPLLTLQRRRTCNRRCSRRIHEDCPDDVECRERMLLQDRESQGTTRNGRLNVRRPFCTDAKELRYFAAGSGVSPGLRVNSRTAMGAQSPLRGRASRVIRV